MAKYNIISLVLTTCIRSTLITLLGIFFEMEWPPKNSLKQVEYEKFGTKSINIMVYFDMFSTTINKILCFIGPHKMKMSHYF